MEKRVIVFQEEYILAAAGKEGKFPVLSRTEKAALPAQGEVFDQWKQALSGLSPEWKEEPVRLVLPAGMCATRVLKIPYGRGKQLKAMAAGEIQDSFKNEVADYAFLHGDPKEGVSLCAGGADEGILEKFLGICREEGIRVDGITVPMDGYLQVIKQSESLQKGAVVCLFFEGGGMTSVLCLDGRYRYSSRSRLFGEPGTLDFGTEIVRNISGLLQFYASEKSDAPITQVFYAGCPEEDFAVSEEGIEGLGLKVSPMTLDARISVAGEETASDWILCIGAMIRQGKKEKQLDLQQAFGRLSGAEDRLTDIRRHLALPLAVFAALLVPMVVVAMMNMEANRANRRRQEWIDSKTVQEEYGQARSLEGRLAVIDACITTVEQTSRNLSGYPEISGNLLRQVELVGGRTIDFSLTGYQDADGALTFKASSREVIDVPAYVLKLQESGLFEEVRYTGYVYEEGVYTLSLSCVLAGRGAAELN